MTDDCSSSINDQESWERFSDDILDDTDFLTAGTASMLCNISYLIESRRPRICFH